MSESKINCPNCGTSIDVQDIISNQLEEEIKQKYQAQITQEQQKLQAKEAEIEKAKLDFEQKKKQENQLFQERLDNKLREEKKLMADRLKNQLNEENAEQIKEMQRELNDKSTQIKELNRTKAEIEKLKREKAELKEAAEAEAQKKLNETLLLEKEKIRKLEEDKNELRVKELLKQLEDQKKLTEEMKRKQEQGSMQLQGEVQELAIEDYLRSEFPLDGIEEIKKGARGGDCIQTVNTRTQTNCGKIYYESKRTKEFQPSWIEKFKADMRVKNANVGVLVTEAMPKGQERMHNRGGIWICTFEEFKSLVSVLRQSVIQVSNALASQENKGDKMSILYDYLSGPEFRLQLEGIVEGFTTLKTDLDSEKRAMQRIWKQREKQIEKVLLNTTNMYGSIKGIAGNAIENVKALELPGSDEEGELEF